MSDEIQIRYGSLKDAVNAFSKLESGLKKRSFSTASLINESRGSVYDAVNECYENLQIIEENLCELTGNVKNALEQCGIRFADTENTSSQTIASISGNSSGSIGG